MLRIRIFPSQNPDPGSKDFGSWIRIRIKEFQYFLTPKTVPKLWVKWPGMFIPDTDPDFFSSSRIPDPGVKKVYRIPNPDPQHCNIVPLMIPPTWISARHCPAGWTGPSPLYWCPAWTACCPQSRDWCHARRRRGTWPPGRAPPAASRADQWGRAAAEQSGPPRPGNWGFQTVFRIRILDPDSIRSIDAFRIRIRIQEGKKDRQK